MPSRSHVWYELRDTLSGQPYQGATAEFVPLHPSDVIAELRMAIKTKQEHTLRFLDASTLLVYRNRAAFDKRNAGEVEEKPLNPCYVISDLGSVVEMLIVVVPSPTNPDFGIPA